MCKIVVLLVSAIFVFRSFLQEIGDNRMQQGAMIHTIKEYISAISSYHETGVVASFAG